MRAGKTNVLDAQTDRAAGGAAAGALPRRCLEALHQGAPQSGRPPGVMSMMEARSVRGNLYKKQANATNWGTRSLAEHLGIGANSVHTTSHKIGLKPQLSRAFKNSPSSSLQTATQQGNAVGPPPAPRASACSAIATARGRSMHAPSIQ